MPSSVKLTFLPNTFVTARCFTNASYLQRITITPDTGDPRVFKGSGEHDTPIGSYSFTTPVAGLKVTVTIDFSRDNGATWSASDVSSGSCSIMNYQISAVVGEDRVDQDWNDAVVQFSWWTPPT